MHNGSTYRRQALGFADELLVVVALHRKSSPAANSIADIIAAIGQPRSDRSCRSAAFRRRNPGEEMIGRSPFPAADRS
jgi:hypothetical protein